MCKSKAEGGQRCYGHATKRLDTANVKLGKAREAAEVAVREHGEDSRQARDAATVVEEARADKYRAEVEYASTVKGEADVTDRVVAAADEVAATQNAVWDGGGPEAEVAAANAWARHEGLQRIARAGVQLRHQNYLVSKGWSREDAGRLDRSGLRDAVRRARSAARSRTPYVAPGQPGGPSPHGSKTIDGTEVQPGMQVWNYNLERDTVRSISHTEADAQQGVPTGRTTTWWNTDKGLFDGSRMWVRHPSTGERA